MEAGTEIARWLADAVVEPAERLGRAAHAHWLGLCIVAVVAFGLVARRRRRRVRPPRAPTPHTFGFPAYAALLAALKERLKLAPRPSQTPLEFALAAGTALRARPEAAEFADVPLQVVQALYRAFYGKQTTDPQEAVELEQRVREVDARLKQPSRSLGVSPTR